jgi:hypothetical protein
MQKSSVEKELSKLNGFKIGGVFTVECFDKDGNLKWIEDAKNVVVNVGLDHILDVVLHGDTQITEWYVGLKGSGTPSSADTLASHAGWSEVTPFSGASRVTWVEAAASGQSITNSANKASFSITSTATVEGAFLASAITGTTGTLFCAADFASAKGVDNGDTLEVTYTISAADDGS